MHGTRAARLYLSFTSVVFAGAVSLAGAGCTSTHCNTNSDCSSGDECVNGACIAPGGSDRCPGGGLPCSQASDCVSQQCNGGCCSSPCTSNVDCLNGAQCMGGVCVAPQTTCLSDTDCMQPGMPICLPATMTCVACVTTADCADPNLQCNSSNECAFLPGLCAQSSDCAVDGGMAPVCNTDAGMCVGCLSATDCPARDICDQENQTCVPTPPTPCTTVAECQAADAGTPYCDTVRGICAVCVSDGDCRVGEVCRLDNCVAEGGCETDNDCTNPLDPYCQVADGGCVACLDTIACPSPQACVDNSCGPCQQNGSCAGSPAGAFCDADAGTCVHCLETSDCPKPGATCITGDCVGGPCEMDSDCANNPMGSYCDDDAGVCVQCHLTSQCTVNLVCIDEKCTQPVCTSDTQCEGVESGPHCDTTTMHCVQCVMSSQCTDGLICSDDVCVPLPCMTSADCANDPGAPYCDPGMLVCVECEADNECPTGKTCVQGTCGTAMKCDQDPACALSDACVPLPSQNSTIWDDLCIDANAGGAVLGGGACAANSNCRSGSCYFFPGNSEDGICLDACVNSSECESGGTLPAQCPFGGVAITLPGTNNLAAANSCWAGQCARDSDCTFAGVTTQNERICGLTANPDTLDGGLAYGVVQSCLPSVGITAGGGICTKDSDCQSGYCVTWATPDAGSPDGGGADAGSVEKRCFGACRPGISGDCTGLGTPICASVPLVLSGDTIKVNSCIADP